MAYYIIRYNKNFLKKLILGSILVVSISTYLNFGKKSLAKIVVTLIKFVIRNTLLTLVKITIHLLIRFVLSKNRH